MERVCKSCYTVSYGASEWTVECPLCGGITLDIQQAGDRIAELESRVRSVTTDEIVPTEEIESDEGC